MSKHTRDALNIAAARAVELLNVVVTPFIERVFPVGREVYEVPK
jgi:hypothetical protein